jgi:high-affinity iron transporter
MTSITDSIPTSLLPQPEVEISPIGKPNLGWLVVLWAGGILAVAALLWAGIIASGSPDPAASNTTSTSAVLDIVVLVFREGLECVLLLSALTAGLSAEGSKAKVQIGGGVVLGLLATAITWVVAVQFIEKMMEYIPALQVQAATGLIAIVVLLVIMNWFFHKVYWGGWITMHNRRRKSLFSEDTKKWSLSLELLALGFTSVYREGVEIVLFLQTYRIQWGSSVVLSGASIGLLLTAVVGVITFIIQRRLPFRKMLVVTGVLLGVVLLIMVGEQAQEMQQAHWISTTKIPWLVPILPAWTGVWFSLFPTVETLAAQAFAAALTIGSFFFARKY